MGAWTSCGISTSTATVAVELLKANLSLLLLCQTEAEVNKQTKKQKTKAIRTQEQLTTVTGQTSGRHLYFSVCHWLIYPCRCLSLNVCSLAVSTVAQHTKGVWLNLPAVSVCSAWSSGFLSQPENMRLKFTLGVIVSEWLFYLHVVILSRMFCTSHLKASGIDPPPHHHHHRPPSHPRRLNVCRWFRYFILMFGLVR